MPDDPHGCLSAMGVPQGNGPSAHEDGGGGRLTTDCEMRIPSHLLPGDSLARGAVGDLICQLISLLLGVSAGSLR